MNGFVLSTLAVAALANVASATFVFTTAAAILQPEDFEKMDDVVKISDDQVQSLIFLKNYILLRQ